MLYDFLISSICVFSILKCSQSHEQALEQKSHLSIVTPQMFGAKANGIDDDTEAIRKASKCNADTLYFPKGIYVINIPNGLDKSVANNFFYSIPYTIIGEDKNSTIIRLGKENGDADNYKGFESIFSFGGRNTHVEVKDITFDFNYKYNPITQYTSNHVGVEQNGQQMAINAHRVSSLIVDNCRFIEHSGTNCIVYRANAESDTLFCKVSNCTFERIGKKSYYRGNEAYHDCSTVGIHADTREQKHKLYCYVENNSFEGVGGNAFDACECSADEFIFRNNTVTGYCVGVMPLTAHEGTTALIENNNFLSVGRGVGVWSNNNDVRREIGVEGFKELNIANNIITVDINRFIKRPSFNNILNKNGCYYPGGYFGAVCSMGLWTKSIGSLKICNNDIVFKDCSKIPNKFITETVNAYNGSIVGLYSIFEGTPNQAYCDKFIFENNNIKGAPTTIVRLTPFNMINYMSISYNIITNCWVNPKEEIINGGLISLQPSCYHNVDGVKWGDFYIQNNVVDFPYSPNDNATVFFMINANNLNKKTSRLVLKGNFTKLPRYGEYRNKTNNKQFNIITR